MNVSAAHPANKAETSKRTPKDELAKRRSERARIEREEAEIHRYVLRVVAEAPSMTEAQQARLAILLSPGEIGEGRSVAA
jgi:hypothetical protein